MTVLSTGVKRQANTDVPFHPSYKGTVLFKNTFDGQLPAGDYPKVNVSGLSTQASAVQRLHSTTVLFMSSNSIRRNCGGVELAVL